MNPISKGALIVLVLGLGCAMAGSALAQTGSSMVRGYESDLQKNHYAIGLTGGVGGSNGFGYRQYFGNTGIQINVLPLVANRGDYLAIYVGGQVINYMVAWTRGHTALRLVGAGSVKISRDQSSNISVPAANCTTPQCKAITTSKAPVDYFTSAGAGFGFEFGAVTRPGFSASIDLMMTVMWDNAGFYSAYPLPYGALMYNW